MELDVCDADGERRFSFGFQHRNHWTNTLRLLTSRWRRCAKDVTYYDQINYMTFSDFCDAFVHIFNQPSSSCYLPFHWNVITYQFRTTPFRLSVGRWILTKTTCPILEWARLHNIILSAYLDDWVLIANSKTKVGQDTKLVVQNLTELGWLANHSKSVASPTQRLECLVFDLNTTMMTTGL